MNRAVVAEILAALDRAPPLLQIVTGPRQVGKTTAALAVAARWRGPTRYASADGSPPPDPAWIETHWSLARRDGGRGRPLLVLDELQKIQGWSETVKALWDEDRRDGRELAVVLLGSSALLLSRGTTESLAGRFYLHRCLHWSWPECREAFGWDLDRWLFFGGYPGAAPLADEEPAWRAYVTDSLVETVIARDVLALQTVAKPALLRNLFLLATRFPAQILSYNKMLGQLQDAGNTTTLARYLRLLETAFLLSGLERDSPGRARSRGSSPKLVLWNNALLNAPGGRSFESARSDPSLWGRLVENAVGAHLLNGLQGAGTEVVTWREGNAEVDYVVRTGERVWALEVKSGRPGGCRGLEAYRARVPAARPLLVGRSGMPLEEFFTTPPRDLLRS